ncbi:MAG: PQQ-binding-like beta-propeller repeat protein [Planctomycetes bacterium]|nr:PQQ-binding-like beta-propeller repeat protein [Planctomycetota bacterium]MBL7038061.1 PQQ-binding-like beta-propeller repeat protein [Pirellulaceae bacterium]
MRNRQQILVSVLFLVSACAVPSTADNRAQAILDFSGVQGGLVVHVGCGNGELTAALHTNGKYLIHGLDVEAANVEKARDHISSLGLYGKVTVCTFDGKTLPYIDNLINLVVISDSSDQVSADEIARVLAPGGVALVKGRLEGADTRHLTPVTSAGLAGWSKYTKPRPDAIDDWTHWLHGPDNNAVSRDRQVGISRNLQWIMPPLWARHHNLLPSVVAMVSAQGRLYYIIDEGAIGVRGLPDRWQLVARDAFNGLLLWKRPIENWGWRTWSDVEFAGLMRFKVPGQLYRRLVAVDNVVYVTLGFDQPVLALDGATGKTIREYEGTENTAEILCHEGRLLLAKNVVGDRSGKEVMAANVEDGNILWEKRGYKGTTGHGDELKKYTDAYLTAGDGSLFFIDGDDIVALRLETGEEAWRRPRPEMEKNVFGHYQFNHANLCTLVYHDDVLLLGQMFPFPDNLNARQQKAMVVRAMDARSGETLWESEGMSLAHFTPPDLFVTNGLVWTLKIKDVSLLGLDIRTGQVKKEYPVKDMLVGHHHRCYRNKATEQFYLAGEEGIEYIDFDSGELDIHHWIRGVCSYGIMPANGCIYLPTHSCGCHNNAKLNGFIALTADEVPEATGAAEDRLQEGPASGYLGHTDSTSAEDWPVFKSDNRRSNYVPTNVPAELSQQWAQSIGGRLTPPVAADNKVFLASQDGCQVYCRDATSGDGQWQVTTEGAVDSPPTCYKGRLIFGTRAGFVYALRADDGQLIWRFRAAPANLRLTAFGQLESPWPVHGSILVMDDRVYCVAGRSMHLNSGLYAYALDGNTGEVLQQVNMAADTSIKGEVKGAVLPDILVSDGNAIHMRTMRFSPKDITDFEAEGAGRYLAANDGGLLDDTWFNSAFWTYLKSRAQMLVFDDNTVYGIQAYEKFVTKSYPHDIYTPGKGYRVFAADMKTGAPNKSGKPRRRAKGKAGPSIKWDGRTSLRAQAMVVTDQHLYLAGAPDMVDENDPYGAFENRKGGVLEVCSKEDGKRLCGYPLKSLPVYDGMAAANGRIYLSLEDGHLVCYGK